MPPTRHPSAQALANLLIGDCSPGEALLIARHVDACPNCASRVQSMGAAGAAVGDLICEPAETPQPGIELARISGVSGLGEAVFRLRAAPGLSIPLAQAMPVAELLVLEGALTAGGETYFAGDFVNVVDSPARDFVSDAVRGCVCLLTCQETTERLTG
jgi:anti-sigma factor ChrR (cupin superfamily)